MTHGQTALERDARRRSSDGQREFERQKVAAHYEHNADIFSLVLDSHLTYSTGIFRSTVDDLETAQKRKFEHVRKLLRIRPGEEVFDARRVVTVDAGIVDAGQHPSRSCRAH